ncbi:hypothetical protein diail_3926 [Diaporthe ilicicola]|nr:hypothetical protein diail_3926 [Diaporthe ilicicola]
MATTTKANGTNIRGIVAYDSIGYVFPDNINITAGTGGFGPYIMPPELFQRLVELSVVQFVWGDRRGENYTPVVESFLVAKLINQYGGNAQVLKLGDDAGPRGSMHIAFADPDRGSGTRIIGRFASKE